jgi:small-conductance mechanosensitive channel
VPFEGCQSAAHSPQNPSGRHNRCSSVSCGPKLRYSVRKMSEIAISPFDSKSPFSRSATCLALLVLACATGAPQDGPTTGEAPTDDRQSIVAFLNQAIDWYQRSSAQQQAANDPSDTLYLGQDRDIADQVIRLSFDFARARAQAEAAPDAATADQSGGGSSGAPGMTSRLQGLISASAKADAQVKQSQHEVESFKRQLPAASGSFRVRLESLIADSESELVLHRARAETLHNLVAFAADAKVKGTKSESLQSQIEELARSVPAVAASDQKSPATVSVPAITTSAAAAAKPDSSGLLAQSLAVLSLRRRVKALESGIELTGALADSSKTLRAPLVAELRVLTKRGDALTGLPDPQDSAGIAQHERDVEGLTADYKRLSASVVPLAKQAVLLDLYKRNHSAWLADARSQYASALKGLIVRLVMLGIVLGVVLAIAEFWRRATFKYVQDPRRRYQFLLIRRIVVWSLAAVIVAFAFASEIGSLATFAGLLTAGLAVALQNVILSVVGYFFLIGKYGVHLGDRVQVAGTTGDIINIGLFRLHLMEIGGFGAGKRPTGRVVVFPNSVVFLANSGLFKQAPGAKFVWHEIRLILAPESDFQEAEKRMLGAVNSVYDGYKEDIERQHRNMAQALAPLTIASLAPESRLRFVRGGLTVSIRYPVDLDGAEEIDDRITRAVLDATMREPKLRIVGSRTPSARPVADNTSASA